MAKWKVQHRDDDGSLSTATIDADSESSAMEVARKRRLVVECVVPIRSAVSPTTDGASLAGVGLLFSVLGWIIAPIAIVGVILGAIARDRSNGAHGTAAIVVGAIPLILFVVVLAYMISH